MAVMILPVSLFSIKLPLSLLQILLAVRGQSDDCRDPPRVSVQH